MNFEKHRFFYFFIVGIILLLLFSLCWAFFQKLMFLFFPIVMLVNYTIHIFQNPTVLELLNHEYFWHIKGGKLFFREIIFFIVIGAMYFSIILTSLTSKNTKKKKMVLYFLFIFYSLSLVVKGYYYFSKLGHFSTLTIGSNNLGVYLYEIAIVIVSLVILNQINKKINIRYLSVEFVKYFFTVCEIFVALFVALIFKERTFMPDVNIFDKIYVPLLVVSLGFFFFLILELMKKYILNKLKQKV